MKKLGLFLSVFSIIFFIISPFDILVLAEDSVDKNTNIGDEVNLTRTVNGSLTKEQVLYAVLYQFDKGLSTIDASVELNRAGMGGAETTRYKNYISAIDSMKRVISESRAIYSDFVNSPSSQYKDFNLKDLNTVAIATAVEYINSAKSKNTNLQTKDVSNIFDAIIASINNQDRNIWNNERTAVLNPNATQKELDVRNGRFDNAVKADGTRIEEKGVVPKPNACSMTSFSFNLPECIDAIVANVIKVFLLSIAGFCLWLSGNLLNLSMEMGVFNFAQWSPASLYPIWIIFRQIISVFVLFSLIWLGIMYMLGKDDKFEKYIAWVILFALFVNFSYPISRVAIDLSNRISASVYSSALGIDTKGNNSAGAQIMDKLGMKGFIGSANKVGSDAFGSISSTPGALMAVIFIFYAAWIFFMFSAMMIARTLILSILIIASPLLFLDSVVPKLGDEAVKLRKLFFEQLIVAPVFMIMLALTLKFFEVFNPSSNSRTIDKIAGGDAVVFFNMLMMLIMLHITYKVTKKLSGESGAFFTNAFGKVGGFATTVGMGVASGGVGLLGRATLGRAAAAMKNSKWVQSNRDTLGGKAVYGLTNSFAGRTYDLRNSSIANTVAGKAGIKLNAGGKMGFEEEREARDKKYVETYKEVGTYRKNAYDKNGNLIGRKGERDPSQDEARSRFVNNAGGLLLGDLRGGQDLKQKLRDSDNETKDKTVSEYAKLEGEKRQEYFDKQDKETQEKLLESDKKSAKGETKDLEKEAARKESVEATKQLAESMKNFTQTVRGQGSSSGETSTQNQSSTQTGSSSSTYTQTPSSFNTQTGAQQEQKDLDIATTDYASVYRQKREARQAEVRAKIDAEEKSKDNNTQTPSTATPGAQSQPTEYKKAA